MVALKGAKPGFRETIGGRDMADYAMDADPDYWQAPDRFRALFEKMHSLGVRVSYFPARRRQ